MSGGIERFHLSNASGWRSLRWIGRGASLFAAWPLWYAFFNSSELDWEALMVGVPALLIGLVLWGWASHRLRYPRERLEIDRRAGVARLHAKVDAPLECPLEQLGAWSFRSWLRTYTSRGQRYTIRMHAVRCAGFGELDLYVDSNEDACHDWARRVDAVARGLPVERSSKTIGDLIAENFDAAIARTRGTGAKLGLILLTGACVFAAVRVLGRADGDGLEAAVVVAVLFGLLTFAWRALWSPALAAGLAGLAGLAFISKPWLAPVSYELMGEVVRVSLTSETHFYYFVPGVGLCVLAVAMASQIELRKAAPRTAIAHELAGLEQPRPSRSQKPSQ